MTADVNKNQWVYPFDTKSKLPVLDRDLLGGKGKNLAEMVSLGIPVPPGFIVTTETCRVYSKNGKKYPAEMEGQVRSGIEHLESVMEAGFGSDENPLLVSVRSGAPVSMPGMMDTVLNLGLTDKSVQGFAKLTNNERLAYDSYRRFIMMYSDVVKNISKSHFEKIFESEKKAEGVSSDVDLSVEGLKKLCEQFKVVYSEQLGEEFPQDPWKQLFSSIGAVFESWNGHRAVVYRHVNGISDEMGTAVNVQTMVFGNKGETSATGVAFTRNPATGENLFYGEYLENAQGEDVVAGIRTPHPINIYQKELSQSSLESLEESMPVAYAELLAIVKKLEEHYQDMQDIEFTIDDGRLFMLQTRTGKRTGFASIKMAVDMLNEKLIDEETALMRVDPDQIMQLLAPIFDQDDKAVVGDMMVARGLNAGPGAASGEAVFTWEKAVERHKKGVNCILVRDETCPDDFPGMVASQGILTARGGSTSHAAVVARGMGKPCVAGCGELLINEENGTMSAKGKTVREGDQIAIDGTTGEVFFCSLKTRASEVIQVLIEKTKKMEDSPVCQEYMTLMEISDKYRTMKVRANADNPKDCSTALAFGAEGVGLCRTEHMFMDKARLNDVRRMFFSRNESERAEAIARLKEHQKRDFTGIFREMDQLSVTIRLLDPPLHEFMPHNDLEMKNLADLMGIPTKELYEIRSALHETNPMLGHRGCRLGIIYPEITFMQASAIIEAAVEVSQEGKTVTPEIMVPLVGGEQEFEHQKAVIDKAAKSVFEEKGVSIEYTVGTMIELPRAALRAGHIAKTAEFFSFGTNDLTQTAYGISRDDGGKFIPAYVEGVEHPTDKDILLRLFPTDPFQVLDQDGVGELMKIAVERGRSTREGMKCGICGEHGGEPSSVKFCYRIGLDYVSCSPYRVPVARIAAAQAALEAK